MLKQRFTSFINGTTSYGIDLKIEAGGNCSFSLMELALKKEEVIIVQKQQGNSLEAFFELDLNKNYPIYLNLRGKGILSKKVNPNKIDPSTELLRLALPNAKADEFYFYGEECNTKEVWVQLTRKQLLDNLLGQFKQNGFSVVNVQLELLGLNAISVLLSSQQIEIDKQRLIFENNKLQQIEGIEEVKFKTVNLGEEQLNVEYLPSYASAFIHFVDINKQTIQSETLSVEQSEFKQKKLFRFGVKLSLAFFLILLLVNFFFFQQFSDKYGELSQKLEVNRSQLDRLKKLEIEKKNKEQFFLKTDLISTSNSSYFADRLAFSKPNGIKWDELNINPSKRKIERGEEIEFNIKTIDLKGTTLSSTLLNEWILALNNEDWVKSINIKGFQKQDKKAFSKFSLQIVVE